MTSLITSFIVSVSVWIVKSTAQWMFRWGAGETTEQKQLKEMQALLAELRELRDEMSKTDDVHRQRELEELATASMMRSSFILGGGGGDSVLSGGSGTDSFLSCADDEILDHQQ